MTKRCPTCGKPAPANYTYCPDCATRLEEMKAARVSTGDIGHGTIDASEHHIDSGHHWTVGNVNVSLGGSLIAGLVVAGVVVVVAVVALLLVRGGAQDAPAANLSAGVVATAPLSQGSAQTSVAIGSTPSNPGVSSKPSTTQRTDTPVPPTSTLFPPTATPVPPTPTPEPVPITGEVDLTGGVAEDTLLGSGAVVHSIVDGVTRKREIYTINLKPGQTLRAEIASKNGTVLLDLGKPDGKTWELLAGTYSYSGDNTGAGSFTAAVSGLYYLEVHAGSGSGIKYTLRIRVE